MRAKIVITADNRFQVPTKTVPIQGPKELVESVNFDAEIETILGPTASTVSDVTTVTTLQIERTICVELPADFQTNYPLLRTQMDVVQSAFIKVRQAALCSATVDVTLGAAPC